MKTAVEWLVDNYLDLSDEYNNLSLQEIVKQAKELEKKQIIDAFKKHRNSKFKNSDEIDWTKSAEQYYNEKFKNK